MQVRLDKLLSERGLCRRSEVERLIRSGEVSSRSGVKLVAKQKVESQDILFQGEPLDPEKLYLLMYKPQAFVCSHDDQGQLIYQLLPEPFKRRRPPLASVGRLDKDTTGALFFTDDGELNHRLISPKHHTDKVYEVWLERPIADWRLQSLREGGLYLEGESKPLLPARCCLLTESNSAILSMEEASRAVAQAQEGKIEESDHLLLTLTEGRYHQVKRMLAALDNSVTQLHRVAFAGLDLKGLEKGQWRFLTEAELTTLKRSIGKP